MAIKYGSYILEADRDLFTFVNGGNGDESLTSTALGNLWIQGGWGADSIFGGAGNDILFSDRGNVDAAGELIGVRTQNAGVGADENEKLVGNGGSDVLFGAGSRDVLFGDGDSAPAFQTASLSPQTLTYLDATNDSAQVGDFVLTAQALNSQGALLRSIDFSLVSRTSSDAASMPGFGISVGNDSGNSASRGIDGDGARNGVTEQIIVDLADASKVVTSAVVTLGVNRNDAALDGPSYEIVAYLDGEIVGTVTGTLAGGRGATSAVSLDFGGQAFDSFTVRNTHQTSDAFVLNSVSAQTVDAASFGDDVLIAGGGNDDLFGGLGSDLLIGSTGSDLLDGGQGVDTASWADLTFEGSKGRVSGVVINLTDEAFAYNQSNFNVGAVGGQGAGFKTTVAADTASHGQINSTLGLVDTLVSIERFEGTSKGNDVAVLDSGFSFGGTDAEGYDLYSNGSQTLGFKGIEYIVDNSGVEII